MQLLQFLQLVQQRMRRRLRRVRRMRFSGVGLGWRPETAWLVARREGLGFAEVVAENIPAKGELPAALGQLIAAGRTVVPHGISLGLADASLPDPARLDRLARVAEKLRAPLVSEHVAFVRGGGLEIGHLMPPAYTRQMLDIVSENVAAAMRTLPVPLALENVASLFRWPDDELDEAEFLRELCERTGALLLLDLANLWANAQNHGFDPFAFLQRLPLDRVAYVHVAGGVWRGKLYHDTHAHPLPAGPLELLAALCRLRAPPPVLLERDDRFPPEEELRAELEAIETILRAAHVPEERKPVPAPLPAQVADRAPWLEAQAALARALVDGAPAPARFDAERVQAATMALGSKKTREKERHHHAGTAPRSRWYERVVDSWRRAVRG